MGTICLQFSTSTAFASEMIRRLCHSPFSHVDFMLPDGNLLGASNQGPKGKVVQGNPEGVAIRPPDYQNFGIRRRMVIDTPLSDQILSVAMAELGKPFDGSALYEFLSDALVRDWRKPVSWFCSELVTHAFEDAGYWSPMKLVISKNRISPSDLILLFMWDVNVVNRETFLDQIEGIKLGAKEK